MLGGKGPRLQIALEINLGQFLCGVPQGCWCGKACRLGLSSVEAVAVALGEDAHRRLGRSIGQEKWTNYSSGARGGDFLLLTPGSEDPDAVPQLIGGRNNLIPYKIQDPHLVPSSALCSWINCLTSLVLCSPCFKKGGGALLPRKGSKAWHYCPEKDQRHL